ncbi:Rpn family recombination-promoting nuclease/putative transposase [Deferribacterales bacterium RsTz2092]|nr:transposase [Deferribacterales bacterium]
MDNNIAERLNPLNDFAFKKTLGERGQSEPLLMAFLNAVLKDTRKKPIVSLEILDNRELSALTIHGKLSRLDVLAQLEDKTKVDIEVQLVNEHNMVERTLFYLCRQFILGIESGDDYTKLRPVITINIVNFKCLDLDKIHPSFHLYEDTEKDFMLSDLIGVHFLDMVRFRQQLAKGLDVASDELYQWLVYLNEQSNEELLRRVFGMNSALAEINEKLRSVHDDPALYRAYMGYEKAERDMNSARNYGLRMAERAKEEGMQEGLQEGMQQGLQQGMQQGMQQGLQQGTLRGRLEGLLEGELKGKLETAKKALEMGYAPDTIANLTGLSLAEVKKLQNDNVV